MAPIFILYAILSLLQTSSAQNATASSGTILVRCTPPQISNGIVLSNRSSYDVGSRAEILCIEGYRAPHTKSPFFHIECSESREWVNIIHESFPIPSCQRNISCPLPDIENGIMISHEKGYLPGDTGPIICRSGYSIVPAEAALMVCQQDGHWQTFNGSEGYPRCQNLCDLPPAVQNGSYNILDPVAKEYLNDDKVPEGTKVFYSCEQGFTLEDRNAAVSICSDSIWHGKTPKCIKNDNPLTCPTPPSVHHGYYSVYNTSDNGNIVIYIYFCSDGYKIRDVDTLRCENGLWKGTLPVCVENNCKKPPSIEHGDYRFYSDMAADHNVENLNAVSDGAQVYYQCHSGYRIISQKPLPILVCKEGKWQGEHPICEKRTNCDSPMEVLNGYWIFANIIPYTDFRIGTRLQYECADGYKAIGASTIECLSSGYWSDYAPKCLPTSEYCSEPTTIENGFYMCVNPSSCALFKAGTEVHYLCSNHYEQRPQDIMVQTCMPGGIWSGEMPLCLPVDTASDSDYHIDMNTSTLTVVVATSCSVLGLLLVVFVAVLLQRRVKSPRSSRRGEDRGGLMPPPPPPYNHHVDTEMPRAVSDEHDRLALIQFADGVQVILPSYDEAVRGPSSRHTTRLSRFNSDSSHGSQRSRGDYRPLPSIPPTLRQTMPVSERERDHHRNSIITTTSNTTRDNLSLAFGSMDTMNVSDGASNSITIGTYDSGASNPSIATSQRAAAGSLTSSHTSLMTEDAPLIERTSAEVPPENAVTTPIDEEPDKE